MASKPVAIGIDLGTTNSCVGVVRNGRVEIIANDMGHRITPSFVAFTDSERLIGDAAKEQATWNPKNTVFDAKRLIGRKFDDPDVQKIISQYPFDVVQFGDCSKIRVTYKEQQMLFTPEEISSMVLMKMKEVAETFVGSEVKDAVITVPAYFNDSQRQATIDAGKIAGLNVLSIINEPTAAAIAYTVDKRVRSNRNILIFDLGGGTFDVVILKTNSDDFDVVAVNGNTFLGGGDFDNLLVKHFTKEFEKKHKIDLRGNHKALGKLRKACECAKRNLSSSLKERIQIESFADGIDLNSNISRVRFEEICSDIFKDTLRPVEEVLRDAKMVKGEIDEVVLAGGSTRIPKIQKLLGDFFEGKPLNKTMNPDEAVAYGAAFHAAILIGDPSIDEILLKDVTPMSLGTEVLGNSVSRIIPRNTKIPTQKTKRYTTVIENQDSVQVKVYEGERTSCAFNNLLGEFSMGNIQQARAGVAMIDVTFSINRNGILTVTALDASTGSQQSITISNNKGRLKREDIKRMMVEAQNLREDDRKQEEDGVARSELESFCMEAKNKLEEKYIDQDILDKEYDELSKFCDDVISWLDDNQQCSKEECAEKKRCVEKKCSKILE